MVKDPEIAKPSAHAESDTLTPVKGISVKPLMVTPTEPSLSTCEAHGLRYDPSVSDGCVLCRRDAVRAPPQKARRGFGFLFVAVAIFLIAVCSLAALKLLPMASSPTSATSAQPVRLRTTSSSGRSGAYYIPTLTPAARSAPLPLLVFLHGTGGNGDDGVRAFRSLADERGFAVLAPESSVAPDGRVTWEVGDHPGEVTDDRRHVMACLAELLSILSAADLTLDPRHVLIAGHSGGASSAPYIATNEEPFTAFAVLHGGSFPGGFGHRRVRGWFSTGSGDPIRPPDMVTRAYEEARGPGAPFEMHVLAGGHELGAEERRALIAWWLGT